MLLVMALAGLGAIAYGWGAVRIRRASRARLDRAIGPARGDDEARPAARLRTFPPRYPWLGPVVGLSTIAAVVLVLAPPFALGAGALLGTLAYLAERAIAEARAGRIEQQLANALDLVVAAIQAGGSLMRALEAALEETTDPLRPFLRDLVTRLQLGDAPDAVLRDFAARVPIETFRLFSITLAVHWEIGGSLASTLAVVARTVRDRAELSRRLRAQSAEAYFSVIVVMLLVYGVGLLMWRANPDPVVQFFLSPVGAELTGAAVLLQAVGLIWMSRISGVEY
jgi:tight adherence protein B